MLGTKLVSMPSELSPASVAQLLPHKLSCSGHAGHAMLGKVYLYRTSKPTEQAIAAKQLPNLACAQSCVGLRVNQHPLLKHVHSTPSISDEPL